MLNCENFGKFTTHGQARAASTTMRLISFCRVAARCWCRLSELFKPEYKNDFIRLNKEWIETYFKKHLSAIPTIIVG